MVAVIPTFSSLWIYLDFEGLIFPLSEVYFRFEGLLFCRTASISGFMATPFRHCCAVSTWLPAP